MNQASFEKIIQSTKRLPEIPVRNLAELIFKKLDHRDENSEIILSHDNNRYIRILLKKYRSILLQLYQTFTQKGFNPGDTILLASVPGNNECYVALLFSALASFGIRVLLPMFMESSELDNWLEMTGCRAIIYPAMEIFSLNHHEREKTLIHEIKQSAKNKNLPLFDNLADFNLRDLVQNPDPNINIHQTKITQDILNKTDESTEALIITTSGSSGTSQLVVYEQGAFLRSCASWQSAGFFEKNRFAGRGFTPLFTHTMGIRTFFNALWSGNPICLINTEWFAEKPEAVRYFLIQMKPEHVTGGPAAFRLLLEMMRNFPELKTELMAHMKIIISSGASIKPDVVSEIESVFNVHVYNAYGTTETQQVLNTLLITDASPEDRFTIGEPLPGVSLGLKRYTGKHLYRLYIQSPFGCKHVLREEQSENKSNGYFCTGDIVRYENQKLSYVGRENSDFIKDGFGVKIPLAHIKAYYENVLNACAHLEFLPLLNEPGLAALIFTPEDKTNPENQTEDKSCQFFTQIIEKTNDHLFRKLDPFVYRHHTIRRFTIVNEPVPITAKGSIAHHQIKTKYTDLITNLVSVFPDRKTIKKLKSREDCSDPFTRCLNPYIGGMLHGLKMDFIYHRSQKDSLFTYKAQKEVQILDMTGGYGTNLLGHNHPELTAAATDFIMSGRISLSNQGSIHYLAGCLAEKLNLVIGQCTGTNYRVCLGSTGAEVVEMALHHACLEWRHRLEKMHGHQLQMYGDRAGKYVRDTWDYNQKKIQNCKPHVVVSVTGFHGHTSGARSLLMKSEKRDAFSNLLPVTPIYIDDRNPNWQSDFEAIFEKTCIHLGQIVYKKGEYQIETRKVSTIIAAIFEPVMGEGGIRSVNHDFLRYFSIQEFPLIMDEIQCGLGRSGSLLASQGVNAHYYLFAKALGGGIEKIGALLIESTRYQQKFGKYYSSTFANGELAAHVALKTIDIIQKNDIPQKARERGHRIRKRLDMIQSEYPDVISKITGQALMQGISFTDFSAGDNIVLRILAQNKMLGYLYASYLLNRHRIRILPSLSASNVLRIEPSAFISNDEIDHFCDAIKDLAKTIHKRNITYLFKHLMDDDEFSDNKGKESENGYFYSGMDKPSKGAVQVTFIGHFAYPVDELRAFEKDFYQVSDTGLRILVNRIQHLMEMKPVTLFQKNIFNKRIHFTCMIIPLDSAELERLHREGKRKKIVNKIQKAIDMAVANGSRVISLGGYTSILTNNGMAVAAPENVKIITGNTLTAASGLQRVLQAIKENNCFHKKNVIAIVGTPGNIGSILSEQMIPRDDLFSEVIIIGRKRKQLEHFYNNLQEEIDIPSGVTISLETELKCLTRCDVIIISTNTNDPIIFRHHIKPTGKVLIADNSVPAAVAKEVMTLPNVISLPFASYIQLPQDPDFMISSYTPRGTVFCCAAEAMLCGLENVSFPLKGKITNEAVVHITGLAEKHGFFDRMGGIVSYKTER